MAHPRSACGASPSRGRRQWTGGARSTASAWLGSWSQRTSVLLLSVLLLCGAGGALGSDVLGFLTYDTTHPTGSGRYVLGSVTGFRTCFNTALVIGGPGGPVFSNAIPQAPRLVGTFDALTNALAGLGPTWLLISGHDTVPGAVNIPWFPAASVGPSGATGVTGGFAVTVPPFPTLPGIELLWYSTPLALSASIIPGNFLDPLVNNGHSNSLSYPVQFHP